MSVKQAAAVFVLFLLWFQLSVIDHEGMHQRIAEYYGVDSDVYIGLFQGKTVMNSSQFASLDDNERHSLVLAQSIYDALSETSLVLATFITLLYILNVLWQ